MKKAPHSISRPVRGFRCWLLLSAFVLPGCASIPDLGALPVLAGGGDLAAGDSFRAPHAEWPADQWWNSYGDGQLTTLIEEALANAPDLAKAEARLRAAEAAATQAHAALLPSINAQGSVTGAYLSPSNAPDFVSGGWADVAKAGLNFSYEFDFWGKNRANFAASISAAEAARADAAAARLVLSTSIAAAYGDLAQLYADRDAAEDAVRVRKSSVELLSGRFAEGLENEGAVKRAEAGRAAAEAQLAAVVESVALTKNRLAALLGAGPDRGLAIARPKVTAIKTFGLPETLEADLIGRRPDILAARLRAQSAAESIKAAKADFYPNVNLTALVATQTFGLASLARQSVSYGAVGPAVSLPIFDGGRLSGAYRGARAQYDEAVAVYDAALAQALKDVADVATSSRALEERLSKSRDAFSASGEAYAISLSRYRGGLATYLDVLSAEDALITDRRTVADLETRAFALDIALVRALGGGFRS